MNTKEIGELRRRFRPNKNSISRIYGCYVNDSHEIVSLLDEPVGTMPEEEAENYLRLLKKSLSGNPGKNLIDIVFSTEQVMKGEEHKLLMRLRQSGLKDEALLREFYQHIIESLELEGSYLVLLACDAYDVPYKGGDGESQADAGDEVFTYLVCAVCPVKQSKQALTYFSEDNEFHNGLSGSIVAPPELGFTFPAFDDRRANIYNALFYSRSADALHQEFIDGIFHTEPPMPAAEQKELFQSALTGALEESCNLEVVQAVHDGLRELIERHAETKDPEPLLVTKSDVGSILSSCGVGEDQVAAFGAKYEEQFGNAAIRPENVIDAGRLEVSTDEVKIIVNPDRSDLVESRVIDGVPYLLIRTDGSVSLNGMPVKAK